MTTPAFLVRLMQYHSLSRRLRLGPEDAMAIPFANALRVHTLEGRLHAVWTHTPNELAGAARATPAAAIARAAGMITGASDYLFMWADGSGVLEAKSKSGSLSPAQKDWREWCAARDVRHAVFRTVEQGEDVLRTWGVLT